MGLGSSKKETTEAGALFSWKRLTTEEQHCHYDPRFEDVTFSRERREVVISTIDNKLLRFALSELQFDALAPVSYTHVRSGNVGRHLDASGSSLAWNEFDSTVFYFDIFENRMTKLDLSEWTKLRYAAESVWIPKKQMINLGNGVTVFLVGHQSEAGCIGYDLCHFNVEKAVDVSTHPIDFAFTKEMRPEYWGFLYNAKADCVSVIVRVRDAHGADNCIALLVSCSDARVVWQCAFGFIHDFSFSGDGTYVAIFERPKTSYGFVHVLNVRRLQWRCRVQLTYGGLPLGWDGFTWSGDSLVFIAPFKLHVLSEDEYKRQYATQPMADAKEEEENTEQHSDDGILGLDQESASVHEPAADGSAMAELSTADAVLDAHIREELTLEHYRDLVLKTKTKEICVLGIGSQWWDLETEVLALMTRLSGDDNVSKLIFEMASLSWVLLQFDFPQMDFEENPKHHASEVLESGVLGEDNYLLLGKLAKDKRTGMYNHWVFYQTRIPRTFKQMWEEVHSADGHYSVRLGFVGSQDKEIDAVE